MRILYKVAFLPHIVDTCKELKLSNSFPALMIFDHFKGQLTERVQDILESNYIFVVDVPPNCTDRLQPFYVSVNKSIKATMKNLFSSWYADQVKQQNGTYKPIDLRLSVLKPFGTKWFVKAFEHVQSNPKIIKKGFGATGITDAIK